MVVGTAAGESRFARAGLPWSSIRKGEVSSRGRTCRRHTFEQVDLGDAKPLEYFVQGRGRHLAAGCTVVDDRIARAERRISDGGGPTLVGQRRMYEADAREV